MSLDSAVRIEPFDDPNYDPAGEEDLNWGDHLDPYPRLAELRRQAPVMEGEYRLLFGMAPDVTRRAARTFMILGYDEVAEALMRPDIFSNTHFLDNIGPTIGAKSLAVLDGEEHERYRKVFQKAFLPKVINAWRDQIIQPVIDELVDEIIAKKKSDLVADFTKRYPFEIIYRQLQLPKGDVQPFFKLSTALTAFAVDQSKGIEASGKLGRYFQALIDERRGSSGSDLFSLLTSAEADGEQLPNEAIIGFLRSLMNAAGDTTFRSTSNLLVALLDNPSQMQALREDPELMRGAIEELLRWDGPVGLDGRRVMQDFELGGVFMPAGSTAEVMAMAANRDETRFPDPHRFDIFRRPKSRHFGFGSGPHVCIGQHLARVLLTHAITTLLRRLPNLRVDPDEPPPQIRGLWMRVPRKLHVRVD